MVVLLDELSGALNSHECHVDVGIPGCGISWLRLDATNTWHLLDRHIISFVLCSSPLNTFPGGGKPRSASTIADPMSDHAPASTTFSTVSKPEKEERTTFDLARALLRVRFVNEASKRNLLFGTRFTRLIPCFLVTDAFSFFPFLFSFDGYIVHHTVSCNSNICGQTHGWNAILQCARDLDGFRSTEWY